MKIMKPFMLYTMVKNLHSSKQGRLLGLNVGKKLIGLATSDMQNEFAAPYGVLERSPNTPRQMAEELQKIITDLSLAGFVVGHPPFKGGRPDPTDRVMDFVLDLEWTRVLNEVPYTLWDNSFASMHAKELCPFGFESNDAKRFVSKFAATNVLQSFMDGVNRHEKYLLQSRIESELRWNQEGVLNLVCPPR